MQLFKDALIECSCFLGHDSVQHRKRVISELDETVNTDKITKADTR